MAEKEKTTKPVQDNTATATATDTTTPAATMDARAFTETLKQATQDLPNPQQGTVFYGDYYKAEKDPVVKKATIHSNESGKNYTTSTTEEYTFASNSVKDSETGRHNPDLYAAAPNYDKQTVTSESGKNFIKQTMNQHHEYYFGSKEGKAHMNIYDSQSSYSRQTKGNKTLYQSTNSSVNSGDRTDILYTPKTETQVSGMSIYSPKEEKITSSVGVSANSKNQTLQASIFYEGRKNQDGSVNYTVENENYTVNDKKTGNTYFYERKGKGEIRGEVWRNNDGEWTKTGDIEPGKQMKKDFAKYQKAKDKAIKQVTNYKTAQSYMENTPQGTVATTKEVNLQQQSLNYVNQAKQSAQTALLNRAMQKQY